MGSESYKKLLPWKQHREMMGTIVRSGIPSIDYGVIIGLPEDSHDSLLHLEEAFLELFDELKTINPLLNFSIAPLTISPLPGTPQEYSIRQKGLLRFEDPAILGSFFTVCADTLYLSYEEVADWQMRLMRLVESY